jgi:hypothetical protein
VFVEERKEEKMERRKGGREEAEKVEKRVNKCIPTVLAE